MCTFSDVRKVIETEGIAKEGEYSLVIGSDSSTVISHKNDSKEVRKFLEFKEVKGWFEAELSIKGAETDYRLQIILPTKEAYW